MDPQPPAAYLLSQVGSYQEAERLRAQARSLLAQELALLLPCLPRGARVVDLGCGSGLLADALRQGGGMDVLGVDADALAVSEARRVFGSGPGLRFREGSLQEGPLRGEPPADAVVLRLVLMHQADAVRALEACRAWLKPGGQLHVFEGDDRAVHTLPGGPWLQRLFALMQAVQTRRGGSRHLGLELLGLLSQAGYRPQAVARLDFDLQALGPAFEGVFCPVAAFYLDRAVETGLCQRVEADSLLEGLRQGCRGAFQEAKVPLFHAWTHAD